MKRPRGFVPRLSQTTAPGGMRIHTFGGAYSGRLARLMTVSWAAIGISLALLMIRIKTFLDFYFEIVAIIGGGIAGIFALALFTRRAHAKGVIVGVVPGLLVTAWGSERYGGLLIDSFPSLAFPWDPIMAGVLTSLTVWIGGWLASLAIAPPANAPERPPVIWDAPKEERE